jgi:putative toxin-antitoxin system antitoxin component (TIGR02293 family)
MIAAEKIRSTVKTNRETKSDRIRAVDSDSKNALVEAVDKSVPRHPSTLEKLIALKPSAESERSTHDRMGKLLGHAIHSEQDLVKLVIKGLPASALRRMSESIDLDLSYIGPETTIRRRLQEKQKLTTDESERLVRIARITAIAQALFEDPVSANRWLAAPANFLAESEQVSPLQLAVTDSGARVVESLMLQTAHGIF